MSKNYLDFRRSLDLPFMRDIVIDKIYKHSKKNKDIFFATPDMGAPALDEFRKKFTRSIHSLRYIRATNDFFCWWSH